MRAAATAGGLLPLRWAYAWLRGARLWASAKVKLAAGSGAWLPLDAIRICFALAASAALILVLRDESPLGMGAKNGQATT